MFSQSQNLLQENTLKFCSYTVPDMHNYIEVMGRRKCIRYCMNMKILNSQGSCIRRKKNIVPNMLLHYVNWNVTNPLFKEIYILVFF